MDAFYKKIDRTFNNSNPTIALSKFEVLRAEALVSSVLRQLYTDSQNNLGTRQIKWPIFSNQLPYWFESSDGCSAIAPIFDFLNHSKSPNCRWSASAEGVKVSLKRDVAAGDELLISYGEALDNNAMAIWYYGFLPSQNTDQGQIFIFRSEFITARYLFAKFEIRLSQGQFF